MRSGDQGLTKELGYHLGYRPQRANNLRFVIDVREIVVESENGCLIFGIKDWINLGTLSVRKVW